ncbi:hypothetical protein, partial [Sphingomonas oryzagri]
VPAAPTAWFTQISPAPGNDFPEPLKTKFSVAGDTPAPRLPDCYKTLIPAGVSKRFDLAGEVFLGSARGHYQAKNRHSTEIYTLDTQTRRIRRNRPFSRDFQHVNLSPPKRRKCESREKLDF